MPASRKKWIAMGTSLVLIGAVSAFLLKITTRSETSATSKPSPVASDNPEHELKELAVQLQKKPGHTPVLLRMAQLEREKGALDDAAGHLREAIQGEPSNPDAHLELGRLLYERNDVNGAIAETEKVLALNPKQVDALYNLGAIYANLGNAGRARSFWSRAVAADPVADSSRKAQDGLKKLSGG
jgi:cytochrome c-type biogenesis protein CcmH/NrfG